MDTLFTSSDFIIQASPRGYLIVVAILMLLAACAIGLFALTLKGVSWLVRNYPQPTVIAMVPCVFFTAQVWLYPNMMEDWCWFGLTCLGALAAMSLFMGVGFVAEAIRRDDELSIPLALLFLAMVPPVHVAVTIVVVAVSIWGALTYVLRLCGKSPPPATA